MSEQPPVLIDLDQPLPGYDHFIGCWLHRKKEVNLLVDPGPASSAARLVAHLSDLGISHLDCILVTHIHLDHAGGLGHLLQAFPDARIGCSPKGIPHLVDPAALWHGSQKTLGPVAEAYGRPDPVAADRFVDASRLSAHGIRMIQTPGHAPHHVSYLVDDVLYAGEAIATRIPLPSGKTYLRPATPPRFLLPVFLQSIDRLESLSPEPDRTAFGHGGIANGVRSWCRLARDQLHLWVNTVRREIAVPGSDWLGRVFDGLLREDGVFGQGCFDELPDHVRNRERTFAQNSLRGIRGWLESS